MAAIKWTQPRKVKNGIRVQGSVTLSCGDKITEFATARTEEGGRAVVSRLLQTRTTDHMRTCKKKGGS